MATPRTLRDAPVCTDIKTAPLHMADLGLGGGLPALARVSYRKSVLRVLNR